MGGQIYAPGNAFNGAGEFNWWFDPEAAQVVLRANVSRLIIPLDVTNTVTLPQSVYDQIVNRTPPTIVTQLYKNVGPRPGGFIYDTVAFASFYDPSLDINPSGFVRGYAHAVRWYLRKVEGLYRESVSFDSRVVSIKGSFSY